MILDENKIVAKTFAIHLATPSTLTLTLPAVNKMKNKMIKWQR